MNKDILRKVIFAGLFVIPFVPFLVSSGLFFPFITTKAFAWRVVVEVIFGAWVALALVAPEYRPKKSPILFAVLAFLTVVGLADLFGVEPVKSFWSNFERMEGYITMLHLGAFFLVIGSVFRDREWKWWWNTTLAASALMVVYCIFQLLGATEIHQGGVRVDGTLGNAAYLALYFLIHIFIAFYYFLKEKAGGLKWAYGALIFGQMMILYFTATRGAILGLLGGLVVMALLNVMNKEDAGAKKSSRILLGVLALIVVGFFLVRDTSFVRQSQVLERFASLSLTSWKTEGRAFIWPMAVEGIKERPLLGWGQDNFNYVFAEHYDARMYNLEPWFDRAHNIFLDWGISAGILGLGAYLALYVVLLLAIWKKSSLSHTERSVLTGLIAAYFFNNVFVFDNLISYILFFSLLAYIHGRTGTAWSESPRLWDEKKAIGVSAVVAVVMLGVLYFVNVKPIVANTSLINGLQSVQVQGMSKAQAMRDFRKAYEASRLGRPESVEWISSSAATILGDANIPMEERNAYFGFAKDAVVAQASELENDPRYKLIAGGFFLAVGSVDDALLYFNEAKRLMPEKQMIHLNIGQVLYYKKDYAGALDAFRTAHDLAPENEQVKQIYEAAQKEILR